MRTLINSGTLVNPTGPQPAEGGRGLSSYLR